MYNVIDIFAGAGGLSEGFRRAGFNIVSHIEMDDKACNSLQTREAYYYCLEQNKIDLYKSYIKGEITQKEFYSYIPQKILEKVINKEIKNGTFANICKTIDKQRNNKKITGIIGGPPCQAYSIAGRSRMGKSVEKDHRNYLYKQYFKFLKKYNPDFFVFENVSGLETAKKGSILEDIKTNFENLGYDIDYKILDAKNFGVLQSRKRLILIGFKNNLNLKYPEFTLEEPKYNIKNLFSDLPFLKAGEENNNYYQKANTCLEETHIRSKKWDVLTQNKTRTHNERDLKIYQIQAERKLKNLPEYKYNELPKSLITHKNTKIFLDKFKVVPYNNISHTIVAHISKDGHHYIHPDVKQNRSLTVREAARIQSFPDDYFFEGSFTNAFKQIGNAVPPLMAEKIAMQILKILKKKQI